MSISSSQMMPLEEALVRTVRQPVLVLYDDLRVRIASAAFYREFHLTREQVEGQSLFDLQGGTWNIPELRTLLEYLLPRQRELTDYDIQHTFENIGYRKLRLNARRLDHLELIVLAIEDVTESPALLEQRINERTSELRALAEQLSETEHRERLLLAQMLHDHLQQFLVAGQMKIAMLRMKADESLQSHMKEAEQLIRQAIDASRALAAELNPPILDTEGLEPALHWLARQQAANDFQVVIDFQTHTPDLALSSVTRRFIFVSVRELLLNVVKHAGVRDAHVRISASPGQIQVIVEDNGKGCPAERITPPQSAGFGLAGIRQRLQLLGGSFDIHNRPEGGCRVVMDVPIER